MDGLQPGLYQARPGGDWKPIAPESVAMAAFGVEVHFGWDLGVFQRQKVDGGVFDMHGIVFGLENKRRRSLGGDVDLGIGREVLLCQGEVAGIDDRGEVGPATELVSSINGVVETLIEVGAERSREVGSGGETEHPDAMRINVPVGGMRADDSESALGVLQRSRGLGIRPGIGHTVFDKNAGNARRGQPRAHLGSLKVNGQDAVRASGKNDDCGAGILTLRRVKSEGRAGHVAQPDDRFARDKRFLGGRCIDFRARIRLRARRSVGPEGKGYVSGRRRPCRVLGQQTGGNGSNGGEKKQTLAHDETLGWESRFNRQR